MFKENKIKFMKKRILYVEDNPNNRQLIRRIMKAEGHELLEATDGESGWNVAARERPDFILIDLSLPGIDGLELTRIIRADPDLGHIPIVALTAHGDADVERMARQAGCDDFLHKPANTHKIRQVLGRFLSMET